MALINVFKRKCSFGGYSDYTMVDKEGRRTGEPSRLLVHTDTMRAFGGITSITTIVFKLDYTPLSEIQFKSK